MTSLFIILFMFIHNRSSKNCRKTTASKLQMIGNTINFSYFYFTFIAKTVF